MPKEFFSPDRATALATLAPGSKIHVSGVAGVAMAQLALALCERGFSVSGSDKDFYEPMGSLLANSAVSLTKGYAAANIPADVALVVIGNALSYGNPEVQAVEERGIPYSFFPKILADLAIQERHSIVVTGTHGKSTTTAMTATLLHRLGESPSYFIGAVVPELPRSLAVGRIGGFSVVEGDEYDSAFFAKVPKFSFYQPDTLVVTAIEYDHADIYPDLDAIIAQFTALVRSRSPKSRLICCLDCATVRRVLPTWREIFSGEIVTYGFAADADWRIERVQVVPHSGQGSGGQQISVAWRGEKFEYQLSMPGDYNVRNSSAALLALLLNGFAEEKLRAALVSFRGARRRQEVRAENRGVVLIDDFAHHPTAVHETMNAIRAFYPGKRLWAVFEPRSNTSRRKVFQEAYINALRRADRVILSRPIATAIDAGLELIDVQELATRVAETGTSAISFGSVDEIVAHVQSEVGNDDVIVIMSNGGFGGIVARLEQWVKQR